MSPTASTVSPWLSRPSTSSPFCTPSWRIQQEIQPDTLTVIDELAVVTAVGRHMANTPGISGKLFGALGKAGINIRFIPQSPDELNIIFGVENKDFKQSIRVLYDKFAK